MTEARPSQAEGKAGIKARKWHARRVCGVAGMQEAGELSRMERKHLIKLHLWAPPGARGFAKSLDVVPERGRIHRKLPPLPPSLSSSLLEESGVLALTVVCRPERGEGEAARRGGGGPAAAPPSGERWAHSPRAWSTAPSAFWSTRPLSDPSNHSYSSRVTSHVSSSRALENLCELSQHFGPRIVLGRCVLRASHRAGAYSRRAEIGSLACAAFCPSRKSPGVRAPSPSLS